MNKENKMDRFESILIDILKTNWKEFNYKSYKYNGFSKST